MTIDSQGSTNKLNGNDVYPFTATHQPEDHREPLCPCVTLKTHSVEEHLPMVVDQGLGDDQTLKDE